MYSKHMMEAYDLQMLIEDIKNNLKNFAQGKQINNNEIIIDNNLLNESISLSSNLFRNFEILQAKWIETMCTVFSKKDQHKNE